VTDTIWFWSLLDMQLFEINLRGGRKIVKFIYSEKATNFFEISTLLLSYVVPVKSKWRFCKILWPSQNMWSLIQYCLVFFQFFFLVPPNIEFIRSKIVKKHFKCYIKKSLTIQEISTELQKGNGIWNDYVI
jgi:hypothetical protein